MNVHFRVKHSPSQHWLSQYPVPCHQLNHSDFHSISNSLCNLGQVVISVHIIHRLHFNWGWFSGHQGSIKLLKRAKHDCTWSIYLLSQKRVSRRGESKFLICDRSLVERGVGGIVTVTTFQEHKITFITFPLRMLAPGLSSLGPSWWNWGALRCFSIADNEVFYSVMLYSKSVKLQCFCQLCEFQVLLVENQSFPIYYSTLYLRVSISQCHQVR